MPEHSVDEGFSSYVWSTGPLRGDSWKFDISLAESWTSTPTVFQRKDNYISIFPEGQFKVALPAPGKSLDTSGIIVIAGSSVQYSIRPYDKLASLSAVRVPTVINLHSAESCQVARTQLRLLDRLFEYRLH